MNRGSLAGFLYFEGVRGMLMNAVAVGFSLPWWGVGGIWRVGSIIRKMHQWVDCQTLKGSQPSFLILGVSVWPKKPSTAGSDSQADYLFHRQKKSLKLWNSWHSPWTCWRCKKQLSKKRERERDIAVLLIHVKCKKGHVNSEMRGCWISIQVNTLVRGGTFILVIGSRCSFIKKIKKAVK